MALFAYQCLNVMNDFKSKAAWKINKTGVTRGEGWIQKQPFTLVEEPPGIYINLNKLSCAQLAQINPGALHNFIFRVDSYFANLRPNGRSASIDCFARALGECALAEARRVSSRAAGADSNIMKGAQGNQTEMHTANFNLTYIHSFNER